VNERAAIAPGGDAPPAPLLGPYRVLDLTDERGLFAGHLLAQLGAEVIQVEPPAGSTARHTGPFDDADGRSLTWSAYAAGKKGVSLSLDRPEGRDLLVKLAAQADVLIESAAPGAMDALGVGYEQLRAVNSGLVYVSITPFGVTGPKTGYADSDLIVWASAGPLAPHRSDAGSPLRISAPQAFLHAASDAACGALLALLARGTSGAGQRVDVSAQASCTLCTLFQHLSEAVGHTGYHYSSVQQVKKAGSQAPLDLSGSGARTRQTKWQVRDGLVEMHVGVGAAAGRFSNALFAWFAELGERPEEFGWDWLTLPEQVANGEISIEQIDRARDHVATVLARFTVQELVLAATEKGFMLAPLMTTADLLTSPQFEARGLFTQVEEQGRTWTLPTPFATGCGADAAALRGAPTVGQDNAEVFGRLLGLTPEALAELAARGIV
jgi:crotonobetainyl-CoA:carnitine CoA-transferase CaiB-like acyl-CoA transferase